MKIVMTLHIAAGIAALVFGFYNLLNQTGNNRHKSSGKTFFIAMLYVCLSALIAASIRGSIFFIAISIFTLYLIFSSYSSIKMYRNNVAISTLQFFKIVNYLSLFFSILMVFFPVYIMIKHQTIYFPVLSFFGIIMLFNSFNDRNIFKNEYLTSASRIVFLRRHIGMAIGSYIAATTAFLVNNITFNPAWVLWILPTIVGTLLISKVLNKLPKK